MVKWFLFFLKGKKGASGAIGADGNPVSWRIHLESFWKLSKICMLSLEGQKADQL